MKISGPGLKTMSSLEDSKVLAQAWSQLVLNNYGKGVKTLELNIDILFLMETQRHTMRYLTFMESVRNEIHITKWTNLQKNIWPGRAPLSTRNMKAHTWRKVLDATK